MVTTLVLSIFFLGIAVFCLVIGEIEAAQGALIMALTFLAFSGLFYLARKPRKPFDGMILALLLSFGFLGGAIYNVSQGEINDAFAGLVLSLILAGLFYFHKYQQKQIDSFLDWLKDNQAQLIADKTLPQRWRNIPVKYDSTITQYHFCTSFIVLTFAQPTSFVLDKSPNRFLVNYTATIATLLFGWWGIPWGPISTVRTVYHNLRGGTTWRISDLIDDTRSFSDWVSEYEKATGNSGIKRS